MVKASQEKSKHEHAWLNCVIFNSQGGKTDKTPWQIEDFLPDEKPEETEEGKLKRLDLECTKWKVFIDNCKRG